MEPSLHMDTPRTKQVGPKSNQPQTQPFQVPSNQVIESPVDFPIPFPYSIRTRQSHLPSHIPRTRQLNPVARALSIWLPAPRICGFDTDTCKYVCLPTDGWWMLAAESLEYFTGICCTRHYLTDLIYVVLLGVFMLLQSSRPPLVRSR